MQQLRYVVNRMKSVNEGEQTLVDNSLLLFGSNLYDGDAHGADQMPLILAGKRAARWRRGAFSTTRTRGTIIGGRLPKLWA